eukprot:Skav206523  [mRNA]  locus=scaffold5046:139479:141109:+ [translate_table: standard]
MDVRARTSISRQSSGAQDELMRASGSEENHFELISFHDTDGDGKVSKKELIDSWVMFAVATHEANKQKETR